MDKPARLRPDTRPRRAGLPVVDSEVIWEEPDGYYHHYPSMTQVRGWLTDAGFTIGEEAEGPWHEEGYAYHHVMTPCT